MKEQVGVWGGIRKKNNTADVLIHVHVTFGWETLFRSQAQINSTSCKFTSQY